MLASNCNYMFDSREFAKKSQSFFVFFLSFGFFKKIDSFLNIFLNLFFRNFFISKIVCNIFHINYYSKFKKAGKDE